MTRHRLPVSILTLLLVPLTLPPSRADEPSAREAPETPRTAEIKALIERLGSSDYKQREAARSRLAAIGDEAVPLLEKAAKDPDAERAFAAKEVLAGLRWKLPPRIEDLIGKPLEDYPSLPVEQRKLGLERIAQNLGSARPLVPFLVNVARFDPDAELRKTGLGLYLTVTPEGDRPHDELVLEALDAEPPRTDLRLPRARLLLRLGRTDAAILEARRAASGDRPDAEAVLFLADALLGSGQAPEALSLLEGLVARNPNDVELRVRLGEAYLLTGEKQKGEDVLNALMKERIASPAIEKDVLLRIARAYLRVNRPDDATAVMQQAVGKAPYDHQVNVVTAELDLALGKPAQALRRLVNEAKYCRKDSEELRKLREDLTKVFAALGYPEVSQDDDLFEDARRGRRLAQARERAGRFLIARGLVEDAVSAYRAAAALEPENVEARIRLGDALRRLGRDDEARRAYDSARAIAPKDDRVAERLRSLALGTTGEIGRATAVERRGDVSAWAHRIPREDLAKEPESVSASAPAPLVLGGKVVLCPAGTTALVALDARTGAPAWRTSVKCPDPPEGIAADRVGLEPVALLPVPAAACAFVSPRRARESAPLVALLANEWVRAPGRSWRKATFEAALVVLVDPRDGKQLATAPFLDEPLSAAAAPVARGSRALVVTVPGEERAYLCLVDLVARRARWKQQLTGGPAGRPLFAGDLCVAPFSKGVAVFAPDGALKGTPLEGAAPGTGVAESAGSLFFGVEGALRRAPLDGGGARDLALLPEGERLAGGVAVLGSRAFACARGGPLRAFDAASGRALGTLTLDGPDRAAARSLVAVGGKLFALNGSEDSYRDEVPSLLAIDPSDLSITWRRPVDRPAVLGWGEGLVVAQSGSAAGAAGLRVVGARPGASAVDERPRLVQEVRAAAEDALADDEAEVAVLVARRYVALRGGLSLVGGDDLVFFARALARSNRPEDAESVLAVARARDGSPEADRTLERLRRELGLAREAAPATAPGPGKADPPEDGGK